LSIDTFRVGIVLAAEIATFVVGKPILGGLSDRIGRGRPIVLGLAVGGAAMLAAQFATTFYQLISIAVLYGLGFSLVTSSTPPLVSELTRKELYGVAMGFLGTIMDVGQVLGPILTGFILAAGFGYSGSFMSLAFVLFAAAIIFSSIRHTHNSSRSESLSAEGTGE
jgi:MFS family permease